VTFVSGQTLPGFSMVREVIDDVISCPPSTSTLTTAIASPLVMLRTVPVNWFRVAGFIKLPC
jgi:hypothetical protein